MKQKYILLLLEPLETKFDNIVLFLAYMSRRSPM